MQYMHRTNWRRRSVTGGKLVVSLGAFAEAGYVLGTVSDLAVRRELRAASTQKSRTTSHMFPSYLPLCPPSLIHRNPPQTVRHQLGGLLYTIIFRYYVPPLFNEYD